MAVYSADPHKHHVLFYTLAANLSQRSVDCKKPAQFKLDFKMLQVVLKLKELHMQPGWKKTSVA